MDIQFDLGNLIELRQKNNFNSAIEPIDIIFLTYNRLDYFKATVYHLINETKYPYRLIVVDNKSDIEMISFLQVNAQLFDSIIYNKKNEWTSAFQKGIDNSKSDPFIVSDPDIIVPKFDGKCWLEKVITLHKNHSDIGLLALNLDKSNLPPKLPDVYLGNKLAYSNEITLGNVGTVFQSIKRKYFNFKYTTDWETCEYIRRNGGKVGFAVNVVAYHLGWNEEIDYPKYIVDKYKYFKEKYGVDTYKLYVKDESMLTDEKQTEKGYYGQNRPEIQSFIKTTAKTILDVGCAEGLLSGEVKEKLNAEVWGIEVVEPVAKKAELILDKVLCMGVEEAIPLLPDNYFDTIIFADVLEHLVNPEEVLIKINSKLKDDGEIIISLPNIGHWSTILNLLQGEWEYQDAGILDRTHLRFFTRSSINKMIEKTGYRVYNHKISYLLDKFKFNEKFYESLEEMGVNSSEFKETNDVYQYIYKIHKKDYLELSIVIPFINQAETTLIAVHSILNNSKFLGEIILVDDGSNEVEFKKVYEGVKDNNNVKIIRNEKNMGFPYSVNQGLIEAKGANIIIANNDIIVPPGTIEKLLMMSGLEKVGVIGTLTNNGSGFQLDKDANGSYSNPEEMYEYAKKLQEKNKLSYLESPRVVFIFVLIKRELLDSIGGLDERFSPGNFEDDDYCLRALLAGFRNIVAYDTFVHHYGSKSFSKDKKEVFVDLLEINKRKFAEKWGARADEIWKHEKMPKVRDINYSIDKVKSTRYLLRALDNINNNEYNLAGKNLEFAIKEAENEKIDKINEINLQEIINLKNKII